MGKRLRYPLKPTHVETHGRASPTQEDATCIMGLNHGFNGITRVPRIFGDVMNNTSTKYEKGNRRGETSFALESTPCAYFDIHEISPLRGLRYAASATVEMTM